MDLGVGRLQHLRMTRGLHLTWTIDCMKKKQKKKGTWKKQKKCQGAGKKSEGLLIYEITTGSYTNQRTRKMLEIKSAIIE